MKLALDLAKKGIGLVNPNPMVGAVIVKDNKIIGKGYHEKYGQNHAEVNAIKSATESIEGSTMYVTLEPCSHYGNTPPCVDRIIKNKISKVVIASHDPNPLVSGRGIKKLRENGIEVVTGILDDENKRLNEVFMKYIIEKIPFVVMKIAMSLDGKICTASGHSKWISCDKSREEVHKLRGNLSAILVGVNTVIKDNPKLTCRIEGGKNPIRIITDSTLRIPLESNVINDNQSRTIIVTTDRADYKKAEELKSRGIELLFTNSKENRVDLKDMIRKLGELKIDSILLEGGSQLNFSALNEGIVDKVQFYIAPKIIGGVNSKTPIGGLGIDKLSDCFKLKNMITSNIGEDVLIEGYIDK